MIRIPNSAEWLRIGLAGTAALVAGSAVLWAQQLATADHVREAGFWPTKDVAQRSDFLGPEACARCHTSAAAQGATAMARTLAHVGEAPTLRDNPKLAFASGPYGFEVETSGGKSVYRVTGPDAASVSVPLSWAFGAGDVGQTYLFERDGALHESRLSYFESLHGADFTPGRALAAPRDVADALSRPVPADEARRCFACHATASTIAGKLDTASLIAGVTCEACHGPGRRHVELVEQKKLGPALDAILNPAKFDPAKSVDFCGACHATFWDVMLARESGIAALRSQPNRLQSSRCWNKGDARLTCVACHDPHRPVVREAAFYDERCLSCHQPAPPAQADAKAGAIAPASADHPGPACPIARERCVSCHMPKYNDPGTHHRFTDHLIRVVERTRGAAR